MSVNQGGLNQVFFDGDFKGFHQSLTDAGLWLLNTERSQPGVGFFRRGALPKIDAGGLDDRVRHADPAPGLSEVDGMSANLELGLAEDGGRDVAEHALDEVHVVFVILVGRHRLDHREFRMMASVDAFVAKVSTDGKDLVVARDDEPLEVEFMGDGQVHVAAQGIDMRFERLGCAAAVLRLDDRSLEFHEPLAGQKGTNRRHDP